MAPTLRRALYQWLPVVVILGLLSLSLYLLAQATVTAPDQEEDYGLFLIYLNGFILFVLTLAILSNLFRVVYQWHTHQAGSRFTIRLMTGFFVLTLLPLVVVSFFSMNFIGQRIDSLFDVQIERALEDSVDLSRISLDTRGRQHLYALGRLARLLRNKTHLELLELMDEWRYEAGAYEVVLFSEDGQFEAVSVAGTDVLIPHFPAEDLQRELSVQDEYFHLEPVGEGGELFSRVALNVRYGQDQQGRIKSGLLTALFAISSYEAQLGKSVEAAQREYKTVQFQRDLIKDSFRLVLLGIMVLTILLSLWAAFIFSRRLTHPVRVLVEGTLAVASGDLEKKLPVSDRDDFSLLARSFNTMTKRLSDAQSEREEARHQLQREHDYLYVVLEHITSGVVTLDSNQEVRRVNSSSNQILELPLDQYIGHTVIDIMPLLPSVLPLWQAVLPQLQRDKGDWQVEVELELKGRRKILACRGSALPDELAEQRGYVLVFDDVSDLIQAEHDAAWSEVARRLAHEIKNPLTPIQLSAERLSRRLQKELSEDSGQFLLRMTNTIVQQVDALKSMVNAFSDYAKAPALVLQNVDLNRIANEVVELYRTNDQRVTISTQLDLQQFARVDVNRIRQLLVNLVKNALEALAEQGECGEVIIATHLCEQNKLTYACLSVQDNGPGIPAELLPRLFEPYVTSKRKGTGLGLSIVKKIVEEHGGVIGAQNNETQGATITIRLPLSIQG